MTRQETLLEGIRWTLRREEEFCEHNAASAHANEGTWEVWSAKDHLAHVCAWKEHKANVLSAARAGETVDDRVDIDRFNRHAFNRFRLWSWNRVRDFNRTVTETLVALVEESTDEWLGSEANRSYGRWYTIFLDAVEHPIEHLSGCYYRLGQEREAEALTAGYLALSERFDATAEWRAMLRYRLGCILTYMELEEVASRYFALATEYVPALGEGYDERLAEVGPERFVELCTQAEEG